MQLQFTSKLAVPLYLTKYDRDVCILFLKWAPMSTIQSVIQYLQNLPGCHTSVSCPPEIHPSNMESEMKWLKR